MTFHASKWIKIQAFLTKGELEALLKIAPEALFCVLGQLGKEEKLVRTPSEVVAAYEALMAKSFQEEPFSLEAYAWTPSLSHLLLVKIQDKALFKIKEPVVQITPHFFRYSKEDQSIRPNVFSEDKIFWGLQFAFPQIYQNEEKELIEVKGTPAYALFAKIRKWMRDHTLPTPFIVEGKKIVSPIRTGKQNQEISHPHLKREGILLGTYGN